MEARVPFEMEDGLKLAYTINQRARSCNAEGSQNMLKTCRRWWTCQRRQTSTDKTDDNKQRTQLILTLYHKST